MISGNSTGVWITGALSTGTIVVGNFIGTSATGGSAIANGVGVRLVNNSSASELIDNVISGNTNGEILINSSSGNFVQSNLIGVDKTGNNSLAGNATAITIAAGSDDNVIGTDGDDDENDPYEGNVIASINFNPLAYGISIQDSDRTRISGNKIQTNAAGTRSIGFGTGINISQNSQGTIVGTDGDGNADEFEGNLIAPMNGSGIAISDSGGTIVAGNLIGVKADQTGILSGLLNSGVRVGGTSSNTRIGSDGDEQSDDLESNVIGGFLHGIRVDSPSAGTEIFGNFIGISSDLGQPLGNGQMGVFVNGSTNVTIGNFSSDQQNVIAYNGYFGIYVPAANSSVNYIRNQVYRNLLGGVDLEGDLAPTPNDSGDTDGFLNFPVITSAIIDGGLLTVEGFSGAGLELQFFLSNPTASGFGQGSELLAVLTEGSVADSDGTTGTYTSANVNGLNVGTDTTNRFRFEIPVAASVQFGKLVSALAVAPGKLSEFSNSAFVSEPGSDGPGSSLPPTILPLANLTLRRPAIATDGNVRRF